jgi:hypothetical protein
MAKDGNDAVHGSIQGATPAERLKKGMDALIRQRVKGKCHYTQSTKRMTIVRNRLIPPFGSRVIYEDCSSSVTGLYYMAGLHDPNDVHFNGTGWTGTLCLQGREVDKPYEVGDLVFYGSGNPFTHVAMIISPGKVWTWGHEGGPVISLIDYRSDRKEVRRYF